MKETLVIELKNDHAIKLLQDLEQMDIISIISKDGEKISEKENSNADTLNDEQREWQDLTGKNLIRAYSDTEPEYDLSMVKESNPEYKQ